MGLSSCSPLDVTCHVAGVLETFATSFSALAWFLVKSAFSGSAGTLDGSEWQVALDMTSRWALILLMVVTALTAIQIALCALQGNVQGIISTFFKGLMTWPVTLMAVWLAVRLTALSDDLTVRLLNVGDDSGKDVFNGLFDMIDGVTFTDKQSAEMKVFMFVIMMALAFIAALALSFMLAFRNFALICLVGFAPLAFMAMPLQVGRAWVPKWAQAVIALILAKPIAGGMLVLAVELTAGAKDDMWKWMVALVAMAMAALAPMITLRLFSFMGAETAGAYGGQGTAVVTNTASGASRVGSSAVSLAR